MQLGAFTDIEHARGLAPRNTARGAWAAFGSEIRDLEDHLAKKRAALADSESAAARLQKIAAAHSSAAVGADRRPD